LDEIKLIEAELTSLQDEEMKAELAKLGTLISSKMKKLPLNF
jgi:hypothetical protein